MLAAVIGLTLAMVYMNVQFNSWYNEFYNALQEKNKEEFFRLMIRFAILAAIYITMAVYRLLPEPDAADPLAALDHRRLPQALARRAHLYRMQLTGASADNPDQRIAEDSSCSSTRPQPLARVPQRPWLRWFLRPAFSGVYPAVGDSL